MKIALVLDSIIPTPKYGESERILWWHSRQLVEAGHEVVLLVREDSSCKHAPIITLQRKKAVVKQLPSDVSLVHFFDLPAGPALEGLDKPYLITYFDNASKPCQLDANTVFLSASHAAHHGGQVYVYPGIDVRDYGDMLADWPRNYVHFLAEAELPGRNLREAIAIASQAGVPIHVIGSRRFELIPTPRLTLTPNARFHTLMHRQGRNTLINGSRGLIFPVTWHEPFGLPAIESLYFGCPVFGTPFGALPEIVCGKTNAHSGEWTGQVDGCFSDFGCLSVRQSELADAVRHSADAFSPDRCHQYVRERFSAERMTQEYLQLYAKILDGQPLHPEPISVKAPVQEKLRLEP
ncbi:MAG: hypothetical protein RMJ33_10965 [Saprospiraceae bacterium]|nr:hypothetical protein [Saprospiraceae bacterium]MDW8230348.1 hypothetical protein [Saprospiraceae bacterium]